MDGRTHCVDALQHASPNKDNLANMPTPRPRGKQRRTRIPDRPDMPLNLWALVKNAIGKDLSKIAIPVNFCEPISMLQRLTEDYAYSDILDTASNCKNHIKEMCYVAAFTVSSYASCAIRTGKPFNPLLGETYECDRMEDRGWRCLSEQVRHHPPTVAQHCEGKNWTLWQDFTMRSKFKGNYLEVVPLGSAHLNMATTGSHFSWRKVTSYIHNLVIGKLWVDNEGSMDIINHITGDKCTLTYYPTSSWGKDTNNKKVTGYITDNKEIARWRIQGYWDKYIECNEIKNQKLVDGKSDLTLKGVTEYGPTKRLWTREQVSPESEAYYNMSEFACQLNEPEEGVAPTDSRFRPDQRLMEIGKWEEAAIEKVRLEDNQRARRARVPERPMSLEASSDEASSNVYAPIWFSYRKEPVTGTPMHLFTGEYWSKKAEGNWEGCPSIYN